jgi:prepilin-type N-terminal cleavage/methylation domain-containing protein
MKFYRGFTLIELLVVIAIIGILSSVVLASLTTARSRGTAAAVQNELSSMRAQAELYYSTDGNNSYGIETDSCSAGMFGASGSGLATLIAGVDSKATSVNCVATGTPAQAWAVKAEVASDIHYCVDSSGASINATTTPDITDGDC